MLFHNMQIISTYNTTFKTVKHVKHVVSFIGKELPEDRRSCHQVPAASIAVINLLILKKYISSFSSASNLFFITVLKILVSCCFFSVSVGIFLHKVGPRVEIRYLDLFNLNGGKR